MTFKKVLLLTLCLLSWNPVWGGQTSNSIPKMGFSALTFEQRIAYQRAIEEVYWRHRTWPAENKTPKPRLDKVIPDSMIRAKVEDYLRKSNALAEIWQRPITAKQLQAEIDRMTKQTKNPKLLRELFAALHNDPSVIAECLARPNLADRFIQNMYATEERFHGTLKQKIQSELESTHTVEAMRALSGKYTEKIVMRAVEGTGTETEASPDSLSLQSSDWEAWKKQLKKMFGKQLLPLQKISGLREERDRYSVTAVLDSQANQIRIATVEWKKQGFEEWWKIAKQTVRTEIAAPLHLYSLLPVTSSSSCAIDTWSSTFVDLPTNRFRHTTVWTGSEMIIWGGLGDFGVLNTGGRYDPATDTWAPGGTSATNAPTARDRHTAVWTGNEMIVWGGFSGSSLSTGGRYDPATNTWAAGGTSATNVPEARVDHTALWTGSKMIVWGGFGNTGHLNTGGLYDAATNTWAAGGTSTTNVPEARSQHTVVWTSSEMIVWGGLGNSGRLNTGGRYDPAANTWAAGGTSTTNVPEARSFHTAVWTGSAVIVWGGYNGSSHLNTGGQYDPATNTWAAGGTSTTDAPEARQLHSATWTGSEMIVWGGNGDFGHFDTGGRYDPATNTWAAGGTSTIDVPEARREHTVVWTGSEMIVWGGFGYFGFLNTGGRYDPATNTWTIGGTSSVFEPRYNHTAVWTGTEMIIWGGRQGNSSVLNTGDRYDPATNTWAAGGTSTIDVPEARRTHTAIWTGSEMIIWGGLGNNGRLNTGGRYDPATNTWAAGGTSSVDVPEARYWHTSIWTGSEMIVWGGLGISSYLNTGGRYDPATNTWAPGGTSTTLAAEARYWHTAIWSVSEMIVWGGQGSSLYLDTGGRYDPATDTWAAGGTSSTNVPESRYYHTAVWTGSEMIVWGGNNGGISVLNTGGRYDPATDTWAAGGTTTTGAPDARDLHTVVWTGSEMIVWGGNSNSGLQNTGGRYDPATDTWAAGGTSATGAPDARERHTAVWTGSEMIVWGGLGHFGVLNTGGRYCADSGTSTPTVSISNASINEGNSGTTNLDLTVTLSATSSQDVTIDYQTADDTATDADNDYEPATDSIMILAGETEGTISITVNGDTKFENNETFTVTLTSADNATIDDGEATGTINNDDAPPVITINDKSIQEPASGTGSVNANFTVTVTPASGAVVEVNYATANGTATAGQDYNEINTTTLTIPAGQAQGIITVEVLGDGKAEANETYFVNLSSPSGATISDAQGKGTITNRKPGLTINDVSQSEGDSGTTNATFTVTPSFIYDAAITVNYTTQDGTATQPSDYTLTSGTLNIPASAASGVIDVPIVGETLAEPNETYTVKLSSATNATLSDSTGAVTILNDDGALPTLSVNDVSLSEGDSGTIEATFTITQSAVSGSNTTVKFATQDGTAKQPGDYTKKSVTVTIPQGSTEVQVSVTINGDTLYEADETFKVNLTMATGATIADGQGIGTIQNDDTAPTLSINDISVNETEVNQSVTFTVSLSQVSGVAATVLYSTANGSAVEPGDYTKKTNINLSIPAGTLSKTFNITVKGDAIAEPQESFFVNLSSPVNATILDGQGECTINDND